MDTSKAPDDDGPATEMSGLQSGMFATATLTIVLISNGHPIMVIGLKQTSHSNANHSLFINKIKHHTTSINVEVSAKTSQMDWPEKLF